MLLALSSVSAALLAPVLFKTRPLTAARAPLHETAIKKPVAYQTQMVVREVKRKVYPYSIVPGGAEDVRQAKRAMTDPAISYHYADFNLAQLHEVKLTTNISGYVSYRWGDKIYWTAKKLTIRAGETVFTDGTHIARGRCLNCYSALPMAPVRKKEPTEFAMDVPVEMPVTVYSFPQLPVYVPELPPPPEELTPTVPVIGTGIGGAPTKGGGLWFPLIPIIPPIHRHPGSPSTPVGPIAPPPGGSSPVTPPPIAIVPEPSYSWLLALGLLGVGYVARRRNSARAK